MFSPAPAAGPSITTIHVLTGIVSVITLGGISYGLYSDHCRRRDSQFHKNPKKPSRNGSTTDVYQGVYDSASDTTTTMSSWRPPGPQGNPHSSRKKPSGPSSSSSKGKSNAVQTSLPAQLQEREALFDSYEHLSGLERGDVALTMLRKLASIVKPIMRKHTWHVRVLAEFLPPEQNLLGLNINKGYKILIRLRYHHNADLFLPLEECVDTMLHELTHNVWGDHDSNFYRLWEELRDEHEVLVRKGYTGEGFLGSGKRLGRGGGAYWGRQQLPAHEVRRLARESAEKRKQQGMLGMGGSGQRLGGAPIPRGQDIRAVIADQVIRRNNNMNRGGCASGRHDAGQLSQQSSDQTFKTKAEEDDANDSAIAQALFELMEQEEEQKLDGTFQASKADEKGGLEWSKENGLYDAGTASSSRASANAQLSEEDQLKWAMEESIQASSDSPIDEPVLSKVVETGSKVASLPIRPASSRTTTPTETTARKRPASALSPSPAKPSNSLLTASSQQAPSSGSDLEQWACEICTCINPVQFLACDACGVERSSSLIATDSSKTRGTPSRDNSSILRKPVPSRNLKVKPRSTMTAEERFPVKVPDSLGWNCSVCGTFMETQWWMCSVCGFVKPTS